MSDSGGTTQMTYRIGTSCEYRDINNNPPEIMLVESLRATTSGLATIFNKAYEFAHRLPGLNEKNINAKMAILSDMYAFGRAAEVTEFLRDKEYLFPMISDAYIKIREQFPSEKTLLKIHSDPAYPSDKEIVISIFTHLSPKEAIERLDKVDDDWWLVDSNEPFINICLKLEYQ